MNRGSNKQPYNITFQSISVLLYQVKVNIGWNKQPYNITVPFKAEGHEQYAPGCNAVQLGRQNKTMDRVARACVEHSHLFVNILQIHTLYISFFLGTLKNLAKLEQALGILNRVFDIEEE